MTTPRMARALAAGQVCRIRVFDLETDAATTVHEDAAVLFEAPNWVDDRLIVNGDGVLWSLPVDGSAPPTGIVHDGLPELNNDHVIAPGGSAAEGHRAYVSANDGHLYEAPLTGGPVRRITHADRHHFLHGVSPDGRTLAYVALSSDLSVGSSRIDPWAAAHVRLVGVDGADDRALTDPPGREDGPEFSSDGAWVLFSTERFSPGHAQLARIRPDGTGIERLTDEERVDWFPHPSPAGGATVYLSYPPGTQGHPADLGVELRLVDGDDWAHPRTLLALDGGQGTINVPSWAPDGRRFAFVDYPRGVCS